MQYQIVVHEHNSTLISATVNSATLNSEHQEVQHGVADTAFQKDQSKI